MKKISLEKINDLFAAIAASQKLYLPVDDGKKGAKYDIWAEGKEYSTACNTRRSAKHFFFPQVEDIASFNVNGKEIEEKKLSFSAGQYFEVKIEYVELTPEEFSEKINGFTTRLDELFAESRRLEDEIKQQLGRVKYE